MKKTGFLLLAGLLMPFLLQAQESAADRVFAKYAGKDGFTTVHITKGMFNLVSQLDPEDKETAELISGLESIKILARDDDQVGNTRVDFYSEVVRDLPVKGYEELMVIQEKNEKVKILARMEAGYIRELLLVAGGKDDNALIIIRGKLKPNSLVSISRGMNVHGAGLEYLEVLEELEAGK
ncbi:MAG: DUF4252 domain-containing protein [Bacteroidales bacterium]|nr:DUF4252 domain-containing protein [Bacteroidales bacterium]